VERRAWLVDLADPEIGKLVDAGSLSVAVKSVERLGCVELGPVDVYWEEALDEPLPVVVICDAPERRGWGLMGSSDFAPLRAPTSRAQRSDK